jgi:hypothetical protein
MEYSDNILSIEEVQQLCQEMEGDKLLTVYNDLHTMLGTGVGILGKQLSTTDREGMIEITRYVKCELDSRGALH